VGRLTEIAEASTTTDREKITRFSYDTLGHMRSSQDAASGLWKFDYTTVGLVETVTDAMGQKISFEYDQLSRPKRKTFDDGTPPVIYTYGDGSQGANARGRVSSIDDGVQVQKFDYDPVGRITRTTTELRDFAGQLFQEALSYDLIGRITARILPDGTREGLTYIAVGNLFEVEVNGETVLGFKNFNAEGEPGERTTRGNWQDPTRTLTTKYQYERNRLSHVTTARADGTILQDLLYTVDSRADVRRIVDQRTDKLIDGKNSDQSQLFSYDGWGRLERTESPDTYGVCYFKYNEFGDLEVFKGLKARQFQYKETGNGSLILDNQTSFEAEFDKNGDIQSKRDGNVVWTYIFGPEHRLRSVSRRGDRSIEIAYDHLGLRKKTVSTIGGNHFSTHYVSPDYEIRRDDQAPGLYKISRTVRDDRGRPIVSITNIGNTPLDATGSRGLQHRPPDMLLKVLPLAMNKQGDVPPTLEAGPRLGTWFYHLNQIGSVAFVSDRDGVVVERLTYLPYGQILEAHSTGERVSAIAFTGQQSDDDTGLIYLNSRYYDPSIGRFITPDTVIPSAALVPDALNRYAYAGDNPVIYSDPSGNWNIIRAAGGGSSVAPKISFRTHGKIP
jgi:RHS repeat-associated protein